ncbi:hypothetical protein [Micromonospora coerulea]|uniref:hypothetical protein n=1 Tax=Micromonospora coerulea TaxID=47856 RepID=UPI00190688E1|nr:hypothetical protein [Micromonospora veneta]
MTLNYREFPDKLRVFLGPAASKARDIDHWEQDMRSQTLLVRNDAGDYRPAHRSLLEFFVAYKFAAELGLLGGPFLDLIGGVAGAARRDLVGAHAQRETTGRRRAGPAATRASPAG